MLLAKIYPVLSAILALLCSTSCLAQDTALRFLPSHDTLVYSPCGSPTGYHRIEIFNPSDSEQAIQLSRVDHQFVTIENSNAKRESGRWYVLARDTVWADIRPLGFSTVVSAVLLLLRSTGGTDTLAVYGQAYLDTVVIEGSYSFDVVKTTDPNILTFTFRNLGHYPYKFERLRSNGLVIDSSILADSLLPQESRTIEARVITSVHGRQGAMLKLNTCSAPHFAASFRVYDPRSYFTLEEWRDSTIGCRNGREPRAIEVYVRNDYHIPTRVTSVSVINSTAWSIRDSSWKEALILPGDSLRLVVHSEHGGPRHGQIEVRSGSGGLGQINFFASPFWSQPRFHVQIDTQRLIWDGFKRFHQYWLTADGPLPSIIEEIHISDEKNWVMTGPKIGDTLQEGKVSLGEIRFRGEAPQGTYPVDLIVIASPCDTVLKRTIIMTVVEESNVDENVASANFLLEGHPSGIRLTLDEPFSYSLFDIRGSLVLSGVSPVPSTYIDMRNITRGTYILRIEGEDSVVSRKIAW